MRIKKMLTYWIIKTKKPIGMYKKYNFVKIFKNFKLNRTNDEKS